MTPEEDTIFGAFSECPLAPLEGVPTYEYMKNLNVYINSCSSAVDFSLVCGTLGYLVLTAQPAVFNTHCVTKFVVPKNLGIHPVMPDPAPTSTILSELVRTHKHEEQPVTANGITRAHGAQTNIKTNSREPPITSCYQVDK